MPSWTPVVGENVVDLEVRDSSRFVATTVSGRALVFGADPSHATHWIDPPPGRRFVRHNGVCGVLDE